MKNSKLNIPRRIYGILPSKNLDKISHSESPQNFPYELLKFIIIKKNLQKIIKAPIITSFNSGPVTKKPSNASTSNI